MASPSVRPRRSEISATSRLASIGLGSSGWLREGEQALGQPGGALRGLMDLGQQCPWPAFRYVPERQLQIAEDDRQQIVEIVRDAAGQLPERFHLLRLPQAGFGGFPRLGLGIEFAGSLHRQQDQRDEQRGRRDSEDQMPGHVPKPALHDVPCFQA